MRASPPDWPRTLEAAHVQVVIREWPGGLEALRALGVDPERDACSTVSEVEAKRPGVAERLVELREREGAL